MSLRVTVIFTLLVLTGISASSQQPDFAFRNITINDGLSQNSVVDIAEDASGFIWFATQDGLNRFDGLNFVHFPRTFEDDTSPTNAQLGKITAAGNELWLITSGGKLEILDLYTQKIKPLASVTKNKIPLPQVSCVYPDGKNTFWIGTLSGGLYALNRQQDSLIFFNTEAAALHFIPSNKIRSVIGDSENNIWVLTDKGIRKIGGGTADIYLNNINTNVLTEDEHKNLWVGTLGKGVYVKRSGTSTFEPFLGYPSHTLPPDLVVEAIYADQDGRIWVGTYGNGLYIIDTVKRTISQMLSDKRNPFALGFNDVLSIKQDSRGDIWIGTDGGGVSYYSKQFNNFQLLSFRNVEKDISMEQIRAITTDAEGTIWLGTSGKGITAAKSAQNKFETYHLKPFKPGISNYDRVVSLLADEVGDLWIGTQGNGLLVMNIGSKKITRWFTNEPKTLLDKMPDNTVWCMLIEKPDQVWVGTRHAGLLLMDKKRGMLAQHIFEPVANVGTADNNVRSMVRINDSTLALGYEQRGIQLLNLSSGKFTAVKNRVIQHALKGETAIKSLYYENGWLWAGTSGKGLLVTHLESGRTILLTEENGLSNNMIYGILPENERAVWVSSNKGLCRIEFEYRHERFILKGVSPYVVTDGLQSNEFNTGAYYRSSTGELYFGGINGLNFFDPQQIIHTQNSMPVVLTGAMVENMPLESDTIITYKKGLNLSHQQNTISFNYTALHYVSPEKLRYQYLLEGYDDRWIESGNRNYTSYTNLPPGEYTFKVRLSGMAAVEAPFTSLAITIAAPFWQRWWFIVLAFAAVVLLLYSFYRYRINQLLRVQKVKNSISTDLHDDIGSRLTNIQFLTALSKNKLKVGAEVNNFLGSIDEEVQASAEALNEIVWNIKMTDENLEDITAKMRRYASEVLENADICLAVEVDDSFSKKKMSMHKRRELFMVFKELLNNIRKHAQARKVVIHISIRNKMFYLSVRDDGKGFDPLMETDRHGLKNMKERLERWNGIFQIQSKRNKGTCIELWIPFDKKSLFRRFFIPAAYR